jgi:hypothetical protein
VEGIDGDGECALYDDSAIGNRHGGFLFKSASTPVQGKLNRASNKP